MCLEYCFVFLQYSGSVDENVADVVVMRIKALDKDLEHSDNWLTVFTIASGNDDELFSIETDKDTNEGILKLVKVILFFQYDFEYLVFYYQYYYNSWPHNFFSFFFLFVYFTLNPTLFHLDQIARGF